jgi:hypothetical protein
MMFLFDKETVSFTTASRECSGKRVGKYSCLQLVCVGTVDIAGGEEGVHTDQRLTVVVKRGLCASKTVVVDLAC